MEDKLPPVVHTEGSIIKRLHSKYKDTSKYKASNIYVFKSDWESDFFVLQKSSGYSYEIEIKVTKSDFNADFKKREKHEILEKGCYVHRHQSYNRNTKQWEVVTSKEQPHTFRPNRFYYCVPKGLILKEEVPKYAGLMYTGDSNDIIIVKEAPFIHKEKLKYESRLCEKFYYYWLHAQSELVMRKFYNDDLHNENKRLEKKIEELQALLKPQLNLF